MNEDNFNIQDLKVEYEDLLIAKEAYKEVYENLRNNLVQNFEQEQENLLIELSSISDSNVDSNIHIIKKAINELNIYDNVSLYIDTDNSLSIENILENKYVTQKAKKLINNIMYIISLWHSMEYKKNI